MLIVGAASTAEKNPIDFWTFKAIGGLVRIRLTVKQREFWIPVIEKIVLSLSDQQLLVGIAVLVAEFWTHCSISVYHFTIASDLAWFSATIHLITLNYLIKYLRWRPVHRDWRVALMICLAILLAASCVVQGHSDWWDSWAYDAQCLFSDLGGNVSGGPAHWMYANLYVISSSFLVAIIKLYETSSDFVDKWLFEKPRAFLEGKTQIMRTRKGQLSSYKTFKTEIRKWWITVELGMIAMTHITHLSLVALITSQITSLVYNLFWFAYSLYNLVGDRYLPPSMLDGTANKMSFGQIVPILLLSSTIFVVREAYDGRALTLVLASEWLTSEKIDQILRQVQEEGSKEAPEIRSIASQLAAPLASETEQPFYMMGAPQDQEDDVEPLVMLPRRVDTESGGRFQPTSYNDRFMGREPHRRSTFPPSQHLAGS